MAGIGQALARVVAALLLAFAIASPAMAEIACAVDSVAHAAEAEDHESESEADGGRDAAPERDSHCAFSHGHCGGLAGGAASSVEPVAMPTAFRLLSDREMPSLLTSGPDRPPRG